MEKKKNRKKGVKEMKLGQQEIGVYPLWIGLLLLVIVASLLMGL